VIFALVILVGSMVISRQLPFRFARTNKLQFYCSLVSFKTLFYGVFFYSAQLSHSQETVLVGPLIRTSF
jgi:hypothetical protein